MKQQTKSQDPPIPKWLAEMRLATGTSSYPTSRHVHAEESMRRAGVNFAVLPGFALSQTRKIGTNTNPSRPGAVVDDEFVKDLADKIVKNVALPMMVLYQKAPNAPLDIAGGFNRTAAYALAKATHVDVYIIEYKAALKKQIEEVLPWMLNSDGMNPVPVDSIRDKAVQLVESKVYSLKEVVLLFPGQRQDTLKYRLGHRNVLEALNKAKVNVPRRIIESKTALAEFSRIKLVSVQVPAVMLAIDADFKAQANRDFVNDINKITESEQKALAYIEERRNELGLGANQPASDGEGKPVQPKGGPKTSFDMLKFLKAATPYIRYTRTRKSFKDLGIVDEKEIAEAKEHIRTIQVITNILSI